MLHRLSTHPGVTCRPSCNVALMQRQCTVVKQVKSKIFFYHKVRDLFALAQNVTMLFSQSLTFFMETYGFLVPVQTTPLRALPATPAGQYS